LLAAPRSTFFILHLSTTPHISPLFLHDALPILLNTGMMTLEPVTGKIKVWVGGDDYTYFKYDHVKQSKRQAGSTFKPFAYLAALDRKSTRLNSSHVKISYAVFCLKKKRTPT